jgi:hypothetical protein
MFSFKYCNIDKNDRINRAVFGVVILFCVFLDVSKIVFIVFGIILIIEGICGWCYIPKLIRKITSKE